MKIRSKNFLAKRKIYSTITLYNNKQQKNMTKKKVLLSLDGGGLKGIIQTKILQELESIIREKTDPKILFKNSFCSELSKVFQYKTPEKISEILSNYQGKNMLDILYSDWATFYDGNGRTIFDALGGAYSAPGQTYDVIASTFFQVRDGIVGFDKPQKSLMDYIDIVGGVSIGSIIAAGLVLKNKDGSYRFSLDDSMEKIKTLPEKIFTKNWIPFFQSVLKGDAVAKGMADIFGEKTTFNDIADGKQLLISSTNLDTCKRTIWTNIVDSEDFQSASGARYVDVNHTMAGEKVKIYDAVTASSSYLLALPAHSVTYKLLGEETAKERYEVDGGYINKTPHLDLLSTLTACGYKIQDILMIGVGTGRADFNATNVSSGSALSYIWDLLSPSNFATGIEESIQDNSSRAIDSIIRANGGTSYLLDVDIDAELYKKSFDTGSIKEYLAVAEDWCVAHKGELNELAEALIENSSL